VPWTEKNAHKKNEGQQGHQGTTKHHGRGEGTPGDKKQEREMVERPGPASRSGQQGFEIYIEQDALQSHRSRCPNKCKARQGEKVELPEPVERGYRLPCDHRYQGLPCRREGRPAAPGYRKTFAKAFMAIGPGI